MIKLEAWIREKIVNLIYKEQYNYAQADKIAKENVIKRVYEVTTKVANMFAGDNQLLFATFQLEVANAIDYDEETKELIDELSEYNKQLAYYKFLRKNSMVMDYTLLSMQTEEELISRIFLVVMKKCRERKVISEDVRIYVRRFVVDEDGNEHEQIENLAG